MENRVCASSTQSYIQLKTGIDLVYIKDIQDLGDKPIGVWLTEREWKDILNLSNNAQKLQRLAGKFACKEAVIKVLGSSISKVELVDIEILHNNSGKPIIFLQGSALPYWRQIAACHLDVSISHHGDYALAIAVAICSNN
ncbi:MAG: holo-ACP synthase [Richelia sp. RM1_1_1]|nr:holo-ACP synthase [Richelia sp. RM1_1_1]